MSNMLLMLLFLTLSTTAIVESSSYCMTGCDSLLRKPSLYEQVCCCPCNIGRSFKLKKDNTIEIVVCPSNIPESCQNNDCDTNFCYTDCKNWYMNGYAASGVYTINPDEGTPFEVYCDMDSDDGGWTVFQRRKDGSVDFFRNWIDYEEGFGDLNGEFWLGLSKIHRLTQDEMNYTLRVDLKDFENETSYAKYSTFNIGDSTTNYTITVGGYSGDAGDGFERHNGQKFTTKDRDNDKNIFNCAVQFSGAWWYNDCHFSNLNGLYLEGYHESYANGVNWYHWKGYHYSLKFTEMKLRQK